MTTIHERSPFLFGAKPSGAATKRPAQYLNLPAVSGSYASSPDSAVASITGDIDLRALVAPADWTPATDSRAIVSKWTVTGDQRAYLFGITVTTGTLFLTNSADGLATVNRVSTAAPTATDGNQLWVRVTLDVDNGAAGNDALFYTSANGVTWTQLGTTVTTATATSIFDSTAILNVGAQAVGTDDLFLGRIFYASVLSGVNGTKVVEFDPQMTTVGAGTFVARTGEVWTIAGSADLA